jgi:hypothetical protein
MDILTFLGEDKTIRSIGFFAGMTHVILNRENNKTQPAIFVNPLSTLCCAAIFGMIYSCMASFIGELFSD